MLNKIVCDKDLNVELVINLQEPRTFDDTWANSIIISVDADDTASQSLTVDAGEATGSYPVTPSQINEIEIETEYWNMGGATTITLVKGSTDYGTIIINFPDQIDSLGMLNRDENIETTFTMTGSYNDPSDLSKEVKDVSNKVDDLESNKQNFIEHDMLEPSGSGVEGDLKFFYDGSAKEWRLYRYESNSWVPIRWIGYGDSEPSGGIDGSIYFQHGDQHITNIWQKEEGQWVDLSVTGRHIYLSDEHVVGTWINENDVYERTYKLNSLPSNASAQYQHGIGGFGLILYYKGIKNDNNVFSDLLCDNDIEIDGTYITVKANKAQSGYGYLTIGYTKPVGGYYPNNQYYMKNTGFVCSGWYASASKTVVGDCYCGMIVGLNGTSLTWTTFCISLLQATVQGMAYRYGVIQGSLTFNGQTWFYSYSQVQSSYASSTNLDNTQPPERRFYIGSYTGDFVTVALTQLLESIYT